MSLRNLAAPVALAALLACLPGCGSMKFASSEPAAADPVVAGNAAFDQKDYARACRELSQAGAAAGAETLTRGGIACAKDGQDKAEQAFRAALAANPSYAPAMEGMGLTALAGGDATRARDLLDAAAKAGGRDARAAVALGDALLVTGQCDKAQAAYQEALRREAGSPQAKARLDATRMLCGVKKTAGAAAAGSSTPAAAGYTGSTLPAGASQPAAPASPKDPGKPAKPATKTIDLNDI
jgi:tetratricopeptide (TPR) repeat protein